jgi:S1-C subfamily serine protease
MRRLVPLLAALFLLASPAAFSQDEARIKEAVRKVKPSVCKIETRHPASKTPGIGSGVVLRKDGFIITNYHVVRKARTISVFLPNGKQYAAQIWKASQQRDLAILKINATDLIVPKFGNSEKIELGQTAIAIGSPLRFSWSITVGIISAVGREVSVRNTFYRNLIQTDAAINPGSSGGALCNSSGEVIGINTLVYTGSETYRNAQGLAFAIPINDALKVAQALVSRQDVGAAPGGPAWLGIEGKDVTREMAESYDWRIKSGVLVKGVTPASPAAAAGIRKNDVISELDGVPVRTVADLRAVINKHRAGETVQVVFWQLGKTRKAVPVTLEINN